VVFKHFANTFDGIGHVTQTSPVRGWIS
jgi:hypothetical protein